MSLISHNFAVKSIIFSKFWPGAFFQNCWKKPNDVNCFGFLQIEGLLDDEDFKMKVTRAELEHLCEDMFDRVTKPIEDALKASEITLVRYFIIYL